MTGDQLRSFRKGREWSQEQLASFLSDSLEGRTFTVNQIGNWERDRTKPPEAVSALLQALDMDAALPPLPGAEDDPGAAQSPGAGDTPPAAQVTPAGGGITPPLGASGLYAKVCTELWEMIATGIGVAGAAIGSQALMLDAMVIDQDKEALGVAWGKLAETNATFRNLLASMTEGGAWIQIALVTGTTATKVWRNHAPAPALSTVPPVDTTGHDGSGADQHAA